MLPLIARTTMEVLALVPNSLREASYALGVSKWRTVLSIVLPTALGGIVDRARRSPSPAQPARRRRSSSSCAIRGTVVTGTPRSR